MTNAKSCYACNAAATSVEHVPPRCLFPATKDLPKGVSLRNQLITVPSCDAHNGAKSKDDLFLQYALVFAVPGNRIAKNHFANAVYRGIDKRPDLANNMFLNSVPVVAVDTLTGARWESIAIDVDRDRLDAALEGVGRGLHFHHFQAKWFGPIRVHAEFLLGSVDPTDARAVNEPMEKLVRGFNTIFAKVPYHGANPGVFEYQVIATQGSTPTMMRLHFYQGVKVTLIFNESYGPPRQRPMVRAIRSALSRPGELARKGL